MLRLGLFTLPVHWPYNIGEWIKRSQPSTLIYHVGAGISAQLLADWRSWSLGTIFVSIDGPISDRLYHPGGLDYFGTVSPKAQAAEHVDAWSRQRDQGLGSLWMTYNEPQVWHGRDFRRRLDDYTAMPLWGLWMAGG